MRIHLCLFSLQLMLWCEATAKVLHSIISTSMNHDNPVIKSQSVIQSSAVTIGLNQYVQLVYSIRHLVQTHWSTVWWNRPEPHLTTIGGRSKTRGQRVQNCILVTIECKLKNSSKYNILCSKADVGSWTMARRSCLLENWFKEKKEKC